MDVDFFLNGQKAVAQKGETLRTACLRLGAYIPGLCDRGDKTCTSCMVCLVEDSSLGLITSCDRRVTPGMKITTDSHQVNLAQKQTLTLLLREHRGDCYPPCRLGCPADLDIQALLKAQAGGDWTMAGELLQQKLPFPRALGDICPAPCETRCRRGKIDQPVPIARIHRDLGDRFIKTLPRSNPPRLFQEPFVAVVGAGPAGLTAAHYLSQKGFTVILWEKQPHLGGGMRQAYTEKSLNLSRLDEELEALCSQAFTVLSGRDPLVDLRLHASIVQGILFAVGINSLELESQFKSLPEFNILPMATVPTTQAKAAVKAVSQGRLTAQKILVALESQSNGVKSDLDLTASEGFHLTSGRENPMDREYWTQRSLTLGEEKQCLECGCENPQKCLLHQAGQHLYPQGNQDSPRSETFLERREFGFLQYEKHKCVRCGRCVEKGKDLKLPGPCFENRGAKAGITFPFGYKIASWDTARVLASSCATQALTVNSFLNQETDL